MGRLIALAGVSLILLACDGPKPPKTVVEKTAGAETIVEALRAAWRS